MVTISNNGITSNALLNTYCGYQIGIKSLNEHLSCLGEKSEGEVTPSDAAIHKMTDETEVQSSAGSGPMPPRGAKTAPPSSAADFQVFPSGQRHLPDWLCTVSTVLMQLV